jgi:hypothetical protein
MRREKMADQQPASRKGRRVTIDLTPAAAEDVGRIAELVGVSAPDLFRQSFSLFRLYVEAKIDGKSLAIVDSKNPAEVRLLELALPNPIKMQAEKRQ